jgi:hypothetical protein
MPFCQHCGGEVATLPEAAVAAEAIHVDLEIARVNAERDVAIARLAARQDREALEVAESIAETEAEAQVETAVAVAEIIAAEDEPEAEPLGEPIVIEAEPEPEPEPDMMPPVADTAPRGKKSSGYWDSYR